jgi:quercetin dioxygenase-like cupin family protein
MAAVIVGAQEGTARWFFGTRATTKITGEQGNGALAVIDFTCPAHFSPPPHVHRDEDELFYLLEGRLEGHCDGTPWAAGAESLVLLPHGLPHGFTVAGGGPARVLVVVTAPARLDRLIARLGAPATGPGLPAETFLPETQEVLAAHAELGYELLGPPAGLAAPASPAS